MTSYSAMAARGREAARETNKARMVTVDRYEWTLETLDPAPAFGSPHRWWIAAVGTCGHTLQAMLSAGDGIVPSHIEWTYPIGKRKRCQRCPRPEPKPAPPDGERCTYDVADDRRCRIRARWQVTAGSGPGCGRPGVWDLLCERHRKYLVAEGYLTPVEDGGTDLIVGIKKEEPDA